ncbi:MAG TPA: TonB-dependent receptor, partial [Rudaea sp.]
LGATVLVERRAAPDFIEQRAVPAANTNGRTDADVRLKLNYLPDAIPELSAGLSALVLSGDSTERWVEPPLSGVASAPVRFDPFDRQSYSPDPVAAWTHARGEAGFVRYDDGDAMTVDLRASATKIDRSGEQLPALSTTNQQTEERDRASADVKRRFDSGWTFVAGAEGAVVRTSEDFLTQQQTSRFESGNRFTTRTSSAWVWAEHPLGERWNAGIGLRWLRERVEQTSTVETQSCDANLPARCAETQIRVSGDTTDRIPIPLATLEWRPSPDHTLQLTQTNGYRSGGLVTPQVLYKPEQDRTTEAGWTAQWLGGALRTTTTIFQDEIDDRYTFFSLDNNYSKGRARVRGAEFEADAELSPLWHVRSGLGLLDARYIHYNTGAGDEAGNTLPSAPHRTGVLGLRFGADRQWYGSLDAYYAAPTELDLFLRTPVPDYWLVNLRAGYRTAHWDAALFVLNAFNARYIDRVDTIVRVSPSPPIERYRLGDPRQFEFRWSWNF